MQRRFFLFISGLLFILLSGCNATSSEDQKNIVAEVKGHRLTRTELENVIGKNLSKNDSTRLADLYIRNWVKEVLIYEKAKANIDRLDEINQEAEEYKRKLIIFEYEKQLVNERLATELSEQELEEFYTKHRKEFTLEQPIVKGLFLKIPADAPQLGDVKKWMRRVDDKTLEKIEKYSLQNALVYEYFFDRWVSLGDLMKNIPYEMANGNRFLKENNFLEVTHDKFWYYLYIDSYQPAGQEQPYEYARERVREVLLNHKKRGFIQSVEEELYQKALRDEKIKYYGQASTDEVE